MKNFQQTPFLRRVMVSKAKTDMQNARNKGFQPVVAWSRKKKIGGVFIETLNIKQESAGHMGAERDVPYWPEPFTKPHRAYR